MGDRRGPCRHDERQFWNALFDLESGQRTLEFDARDILVMDGLQVVASRYFFWFRFVELGI